MYPPLPFVTLRRVPRPFSIFVAAFFRLERLTGEIRVRSHNVPHATRVIVGSLRITAGEVDVEFAVPGDGAGCSRRGCLEPKADYKKGAKFVVPFLICLLMAEPPAVSIKLLV